MQKTSSTIENNQPSSTQSQQIQSQSKNKDYDYIFKLVLIGDSNVGKTNLLLRYTQNEFIMNTSNTVGAEISAKKLKIKNKQNEEKIVKVHIWDTAGQERFRSITTHFYQAAQGVILVYDISNKQSFQNINGWLEEVTQNLGQNVIKLLVGNKKDLAQLRDVSTEEALQFAEQNNMAYLEMSALDGSNVQQGFDQIANEIFKIQQFIITQKSNKKLTKKVQKQKCC